MVATEPSPTRSQWKTRPSTQPVATSASISGRVSAPRWKTVGAALAVTGLVAAGCSSGEAATPADASPKKGGVLKVGMFAEPTALNPLSQDINAQYVTAQLYPSLLRYDAKVTPKPHLATKWEVSPDGLTYTFRLRQGAQWSDGKPITSADVAFSFEEMIPKYQAAGRANFGVISRITTPDAQTVVFTLKQQFAPFLTLMNSLYAPIVPKHVYEGSDPTTNKNSTSAAVTGGSFVMKEWVKGDHITLSRNPKAFDPPLLDEIVFRPMPDASARMLGLKTGAVDYLPPGALPYNAIASLKSDGNLTVVQAGDEAAGKVLTLGFNLRRKPFNDVRVRQAISLAIDKEFIAKVVSYGHETAATGPLNSKSWGWDKSLRGHQLDRDKAAKLLDEAGYPKGPGGTRFKMQVTTRPSVAVFHKANEVVVKNLQDIGIDASLRPLESAPYAAATYVEADFDMSATAWISAFDPNNLTPLYTCDNIRPQPYSNFMGYCNKKVDQLLATAAREPNQEKRKQTYTQAQQLIIDDAPAVWPMNWSDWSAFRKTVHGAPAGPWDGRDPLDDVWVATGR